jgi:hypothetical protein
MSDTRRCPACKTRVAPTVQANIEQHADTLGRRCDTSGEPFRALSMHQPHSSFGIGQHTMYEEVLTARVLNPRATLAELADQLGMSKDTYAGRLRRALRYAQRIQERAA